MTFDYYKPFCCGGEVYPNDGYRGCCGNMALSDNVAVRCCTDVVYSVTGETGSGLHGCCNGVSVYDTVNEVCCSADGVHSRTESNACCSGVGYHTSTHGCCGGSPFDHSTHYCCIDEIRVKLGGGHMGTNTECQQ